MRCFLDTNICVYYLKGISARLRVRLLEHSPADIKIPAIVKAELLLGALKSIRPDDNLVKVLRFLEPFEIVAFDDGATQAYAETRARLEVAGTPIGPNDLIIAAIVLNHDGILITNNQKEFRRVPGLKTENWFDF
jgi:tRNA(fMet)-specific endonuclease VapC